VQLPQFQPQDLVQRTDSAISDAAAMALMQVSMRARHVLCCVAMAHTWMLNMP
jgi:hypothetical protein